ncbi:MAG: hypothetical protein Q8R92_02680 [Deltaproteobacteria bacterium]|nr:hypothetical protein [Deltaproteobacteria bacterium]
MKTRTEQLITEGLISGAIGYAAVVLFFLILNLFAGRSPFFTAALLGQAFFYGLNDPADVVVWAGPVIAYNGLHLIIFLALGVLAAWLAALAERGPEFWYISILVFLFIIFHVYGALLLLTEPFRSVFPVWQSFAAGTLASVGMGSFLVWARPELRRELQEYREE